MSEDDRYAEYVWDRDTDSNNLYYGYGPDQWRRTWRERLADFYWAVRDRLIRTNNVVAYVPADLANKTGIKPLRLGVKYELPEETETTILKDWQGADIVVGSRVVWPAPYSNGNSRNGMQMAIGSVTAIKEDGTGVQVRVDKRSRSGYPRSPFEKDLVWLRGVGLGNLVVVR